MKLKSWERFVALAASRTCVQCGLLLMGRSTPRATAVSVVVSLVSFAIPFGAFLLWGHGEFGRFVSNTATAKNQTVGLDTATIEAFDKIGALISLPIIGKPVRQTP